MDIHVDISVDIRADKGDIGLSIDQEPSADSPDDATGGIDAHKRNQDVSRYRRQELLMLVLVMLVLVMLIQENYNHWLAVASLLRMVRMVRYGML